MPQLCRISSLELTFLQHVQGNSILVKRDEQHLFRKQHCESVAQDFHMLDGLDCILVSKKDI